MTTSETDITEAAAYVAEHLLGWKGAPSETWPPPSGKDGWKRQYTRWLLTGDGMLKVLRAVRKRGSLWPEFTTALQGIVDFPRHSGMLALFVEPEPVLRAAEAALKGAEA